MKLNGPQNVSYFCFNDDAWQDKNVKVSLGMIMDGSHIL